GLAGVLPGGVPVFRLADLLGRPGTGDSSQGHVVVFKGPPAWGFLVDRAGHALRLPAEVARPLPRLLLDAATGYFDGVVPVEESFLLLLSPERLCPERLCPEPDENVTPWQRDTAAAPSPSPALSLAHGAGQGKRDRIILFAVADPTPGERPVSFALGVGQVPEVVELGALLPVPGAPDFVHGLTTWRKQPIVVVDLARRLGLPPSPLDKRSRLVLAQ